MSAWIVWVAAAASLAVAVGVVFWPERPWKRKPMPPIYNLSDEDVQWLQIVRSYKHETAAHPTEGLTR